ncbi:MAG: signal peptidase I [Bryobacteraceae bacterium]
MEPENPTNVPSAEGLGTTPGPAIEPGPTSAMKRSTALATISWLRDLFLSVLIAIVVILFLYQPVKVEGTSMMPALIDQERIFINKYAYKFGITEINRGDTVVFWFPGDPSKSYIKRVIGVPGDTVEVIEGAVFVNDKKIDEPYVPDEYRDKMSTPKNHVPVGEYFVAGDHRSSSNDSRSWGTVPRSYIYGKAVFVYWPPERMGMLK